MSLVGFLFLKTRVLGLPIPFHRNSEEVNLRFYVRRQVGDGWRRGVVFLKEIVPRSAIAWTARTLYNENYSTLPMSHQLEAGAGGTQLTKYSWRTENGGCSLDTTTRGEPRPLEPNSEAEFILEHYWGYTRQRDGSTLEYQVEHAPWQTRQVIQHQLQGDFKSTYGETFGDILRSSPMSVLYTEGSPIIVRRGVRLP